MLKKEPKDPNIWGGEEKEQDGAIWGIPSGRDGETMDSPKETAMESCGGAEGRGWFSVAGMGKQSQKRAGRTGQGEDGSCREQVAPGRGGREVIAE